MALSLDDFVAWAEKHFENVNVKGSQVTFNSPFCDIEGMDPDTGGHLSCNIEGGKGRIRDGVYRCFKTEQSGTVVGLVSQFSKCTYEEAKDLLGGERNLERMERRVDEFFKATDLKKPTPPEPEKKLALPHYTYPLSELSGHPQGHQAIEYILSRKLKINNLKFCTQGKLWGRIIIPYYDRRGALIYYNGRAMGNRKPKYKGPEQEEWGIGKGDVLYMTEWPQAGTVLYITEGEFDALSLSICGLPAGALGGKSLSDGQVELLRGYHVCLCLDNDNFGGKAVLGVAKKLVENGFQVQYVRPPEGYKDWNEMLQKLSLGIMLAYVTKEQKSYSIREEWTLQNWPM